VGRADRWGGGLVGLGAGLIDYITIASQRAYIGGCVIRNLIVVPEQLSRSAHRYAFSHPDRPTVTCPFWVHQAELVAGLERWRASVVPVP
jgi:hypothetical protein